MFSIDLTGYIPTQKVKEFKQHMMQLSSQHNNENVNLSVFHDLMNEDLYHVKVSFKDQQSMFSYMRSDNYSMISGSFKTLGMLKDKSIMKFSIESIK